MYKNIKLLAVIDDEFFNDDAFYYASSIEKYADIIWYRIKNKNEQYFKKIEKMRNIINNCPLVLSNDYITALKFQYDGIHINKHNLHNLSTIKKTTKLITGYSSHCIEEIDNINTDYYTLSPIYDTPKKYQVKPLGIIDCDKSKKVFALGGLNLENMEHTASYFYGIAGIRLIKDIVDNANF